MKRHFAKMLLPLLLLSLLLTGCWQEAPPEAEELTPVQSGTAALETGEERTILPTVFSLPYAPDQSLDPVSCPDGMQQTVSSLLYEGLFRLNQSLEPEKVLCQQYTYDPAQYVYTFSLREGVSFSDGTALSAADAKATLEHARSAPRYNKRLAQVKSISASGTTLTIALKGPNTAFPALLDIPIVKSGTEGAVVPIGTGPYLFSARDEGACLVANQSWWQGAKQPTDRIALVEAADRDTMLYRFTSHDAQLITADLTGTTPISATGNTHYLDADTTTLLYLGCNTTRAPLNNDALRHALWKGFNRPYVVSAFLSGHGLAAQFPISPRSPLYPAGMEERYSAEEFSKALTASGYTASGTLSLLVNAENAFKVSVAEHLASVLTAAGVPTKVSSLPWDAYTAALAARNFDFYFGEVKLTADWDLTALLASGGSLNYGGWSNPQTDALLLALAGAQDRSAAAAKLCTHLQALAPILPICFKSTSVLMQADVVDNLTPTMAEPFYNLTDCVIHLQSPQNAE